jgi:WD40 repeat protein
MPSDEEEEYLEQEEEPEEDEIESEGESLEDEESEEEDLKSRKKSPRKPRKKSTKMTTRELRQSYISALSSVPSVAVIAATAAAAAAETATSAQSAPSPGSRRRATTSSLSLIEQAYEYSSDLFANYPARRSLFGDTQWFLSQQNSSRGRAVNMSKWAEDLGSSIQFSSTDLLIQKQQKGQDPGDEKRLRLSPYQCQSFSDEAQQDDRESDENGPVRKPLPKKKRGKKVKKDQSDEQYQVVMQIYERNQWYLHAGGTVNTVQFSSSYSINQHDNTCTHYLAVGTSGINWYGDMKTTSSSSHSLPVPPHLHGMGVGYDFPHEVADSGSPYSQTPNLLQIYEVIASLTDPTDQVSDSESSVTPTILSVKLAYCVGFQSIGPIWDVKWCPEDNFRSLGDEDMILGTVAIVSADGKCRVLVLPTPQSIQESEHAEGTPTSNATIPQAIRNVPIISETDLCRWELISVSECVLSVAWGGGNGGGGKDGLSPLLLACGLSTGSIALWDLSLPALRHGVADENHRSTRSQGPAHDSKLVVSYLPVLKFVDLTVRVGNTATSNSRAVACGVRVLSFCPYDGDLLASGGYDGTLKVCPALPRSLLTTLRSGISGTGSVRSTLVTTQLPGSMPWNGISMAAGSCGLLRATPR